MKIKNYTTMKISDTFCSLRTTVTVILLGVLLLANTKVNAQNNALHFDGANDYVELPLTINDQISTNTVTVEGWFYFETFVEGVSLIGETFNPSGGDSTVKFELFYLFGNINVDFSNDGIAFPSVSFAPPALNTWVHIAATYDGANLRLFYNGAQVASQATIVSLPTSGNGLWVLGKRTDEPGFFGGKMDEIRIWNITRSEGEILANYKNQVPDNSTGLVAYYKMDQGVAGGNNVGITSLTNSSSLPSLDGTLIGPFALTGGTSNFVETGIPTVYNGGWSQGAPNATRDASIEGNYSVAANIAAKTLTVNNSAVVTIPSGNTVTVTDAVTVTAPATFTLSNNANLIQVNSGANSGAITVNRNSSLLLRLDYTLWSSPVTGAQTLASFSPLTSLNRFYDYDTNGNQYTAVVDPTSTSFVAGKGNLIRMPNNADAVTPTAYQGVFAGVPNNGDVSFTLSTAGSGFNLVGNPYPSPVTMATLVADNSSVISTSMYFWRKTNGLGSAYCTYNTTSSVFVNNGNAQSVNPEGIIQTGQGFFVQAIAPGSLVFKNGQRAANTTGQFFKTKQAAASNIIWLNASNTANDFSQMAINYTTGATLGVDAFDGKYINDSAFALTSNVNNGEYTIQGRPEFDSSDVVSLNFKTDKAGIYTIAVDHSEGVFASGQEVYLVDSKTGAETNLTTTAYTFTATAGVDNARFSLKYQKTLSVDAPALNENSVSVYTKNGTLYVNAGEIAINNIQVYDVQGRLLAERRNVKASTATLDNLKANNQVLLVKISGVNNEEVTKKVLN